MTSKKNGKATKRIVLGMSGGVDSSMSLVLLKKQGWQPVGLSLKLSAWEGCGQRENACCTEESLLVAKAVCKKLGVPHYIYGVGKEFETRVIGHMVSELKAGRTPNPCAECNRSLKFKELFAWAGRHGIKYVATGHYARSRLNPATGKGELLRPRDSSKDQTYGLCFLKGEWLGRIVFPLGGLLKSEVYAMAKSEGFEIFLKKKQSQDLCFVSGKELPKFIEEKLGKNPGPIIDSKGKVLGRHRGLHFHTVGQRRGLGLAGSRPHFVKAFDRGRNALIVTEDRSEILQKEARLAGVHFISGERPEKPLSVLAQVRHLQKPAKATVFPMAGRKAKVVFEKPIEAVTPGQVCAFYKREVCLGGGIIVG
ncbi:MAG: tRNA 2-thiouridine(34) synthase MnmA [Candidatus Micrarchaeota archaeon]|nr:tRNA 2-thiouridine(34) synthase MnmA [Candidatus Micrarchaeota archaeon]